MRYVVEILGEICTICDEKLPSAPAKLWVGEYWTKQMMCIGCLKTVRELKNSKVPCRVEPWNVGDAENNYKCLNKGD